MERRRYVLRVAVGEAVDGQEHSSYRVFGGIDDLVEHLADLGVSGGSLVRVRTAGAAALARGEVISGLCGERGRVWRWSVFQWRLVQCRCARGCSDVSSGSERAGRSCMARWRRSRRGGS